MVPKKLYKITVQQLSPNELNKSTELQKELTLSQTANFRPFQIKKNLQT